MACTWAVEKVVVCHLEEQIAYLRDKDDQCALSTVEQILEDEQNHRDVGFEEGSTGDLLYQPLRFAISMFTEGVIRFGMR